jgi:hypothetical protein
VTERRVWPPEQSAKGTLRIAARLQQERSILAKAIKEDVVDHRAEQRWLAALVARQDEEVR